MNKGKFTSLIMECAAIKWERHQCILIALLSTHAIDPWNTKSTTGVNVFFSHGICDHIQALPITFQYKLPPQTWGKTPLKRPSATQKCFFLAIATSEIYRIEVPWWPVESSLNSCWPQQSIKLIRKFGGDFSQLADGWIRKTSGDISARRAGHSYGGVTVTNSLSQAHPIHTQCCRWLEFT